MLLHGLTLYTQASHGTTPSAINLQKHRPGSAVSAVFKLTNETAVRKQTNNKRTKNCGHKARS